MNSYHMLSQTMSQVQKSKNNSSGRRSGNNSGSKTSRNKPEEINLDSSPDEQETETDPNVPDRSYGDYFCKICDSHMNSDNMWEAHVTGKRHIKNVKKGDTDSKYEDLENEESNIKYEIRNVKDPIIGLSYIHEIRRREPNVPPLYNCFLCHASIATIPLVIEHVISMKHRLNYIKENNPEEYQLLDATNLKKGHMEPLVLEAAIRMEEKDGRGTVKVKQEKKKIPPTFTWGKSYETEHDDREIPPRNNIHTENSSVWRSLDPLGHHIQGSSAGRRERSKSPRDHYGSRKRSRSRSPRGYKESHKRYSVSPKRDHDSYSRRDRDHHDEYAKRSDRDKEHYDDYSKRSDRDKEHYDEYKRKSDRQSYSGSSRKTGGDYVKRYDDDLRKSDKKKDCNLSPPYNKESSYLREPVVKDLMIRPNPPKDVPDKYYEKPNPYESHLLPHEKTVDKPTTGGDINQFVMSILSLPSEIFLKIAITKVETLQVKGLDDLKLLYKLSATTQAALNRELPNDLLQFFKQTNSQDAGSIVPSSSIPGLDVQTNMPSSNRPNNKDHSKFLSDILSLVNKSNSTTSIQGNVQVPQNVSSFAPSNALPSISAPAFISPPANSYQTSSATYQTSSATYQTPSTTYQTPSTTYQTPSTTYQTPSQNAPSNSYQTTPSNPYHTPSANPYPSQNSNSYQNLNPTYTYNNPQPSTSSNIPGLTLTELVTPEPCNYDYNYSSATNKYSLRY